MLANVVLPQVLLIVMAAAVVWFGVSRGLAPLQRLRAAVADRSHLDLSPIDVHAVPGEVRPLVDEVNELMARLGRTFDFQNRFVADAAHQLKTPVSGIKAQIELALGESDLERVRHSLAQLYISADRLSRLVRQLLSLARNEPGALDFMQLQPLDLNAYALEMSMEWVPRGAQAQHRSGLRGRRPSADDRCRPRPPARAGQQPHRQRDSLQPGGRAGDGAGRRSRRTSSAGCSSATTGRSIPVEERERIFERFHRLLGTHEDGSGLGLAIVSEIATLHGARITLEEDTDGVGNTFSVFFPLRGA